MKLNNYHFLILVTGFFGGFTTFSAFAFDGVKLIREGLYNQFFLYISISVIGGLLLCIAGFFMSNRGIDLEG